MSERDKAIEEAMSIVIMDFDDRSGREDEIAEMMADFSIRENARLLLLLADIRSALGDPEGKMMQEDFVKHCKEVVAERDRLREWVKGLTDVGWRENDRWITVISPNDNEYWVVDRKKTIAEGETLVSAVEAYLKDKAALAGKE